MRAPGRHVGYGELRLLGGLLHHVVERIDKKKEERDMATEHLYHGIGRLEYDAEKGRYSIGIPIAFVREGQHLKKDYRMTFFEREVREGKVHEHAIEDRVRKCVNFFRSRGMEVKELRFSGLGEKTERTVEQILANSSYSIVALSAHERKDFDGKKHVLGAMEVGKEGQYNSQASNPERVVVHTEIPFHIRDKNGYKKVVTRQINFAGKQIDLSGESPRVLGVALKSVLEYQVGAFNRRGQGVERVDLEKTGLAPAVQSYLQDSVRERNLVYGTEREEGRER